jgi:hypothetical protein
MMHQNAKDRYRDIWLRCIRLAKAGNPEALELADDWLDMYNESNTHATEWDADQWGFDSDRWMERERLILQKRANGQLWPSGHGPIPIP